MIHHLLLDKAKQKGTDAEYQSWVRQWPSILTNDFKEWPNGEGRSVYAHVRRVSAGAGTAEKPEYCGVPLTQDQHAKTHEYGESYYGPSDWWEGKATDMLVAWVNGEKPPVLEEKRTKETYKIECAEHMRAFQEMLVPYFQNPNARAVEVTIQTGKKRSNQQNRGMWGAIYNGLLEYYSNNPKALATDVVEFVLSQKPSCNFIHEMMKGLCNDGKSTARLKVQEHSDYFDRISSRFIEKHRHEVKMPVNQAGETKFN